MRLTTVFLLSVSLLAVLTGCKGHSGNPIDPSLSEENPLQSALNPEKDCCQSRTSIWGYYDISINPETSAVEIIPNRSLEFAANIVGFLNSSPSGIVININDISTGTGYVDVDLDLTINHPLDDGKFTGYDVMGVFVGNGSVAMKYDNDLAYADESCQMLLNADGYTRWFNPAGFSPPSMFGYIPGKYASQGYTGTATLNPYKYFAHNLAAGADCWNYLVSGNPEVGYFLPATGNTRNYQLRFPVPAPGLKFGYVIVANWAGATPQFHPAHAYEAVGVKAASQSDLYFTDETNNGGKLVLNLKVFDWDAELTGGVMLDYDIIIESTVLLKEYELSASEMVPIESGEHWNKYHVEIPADNITGIEGNEFWIIVEDSYADYTNPFGVPNEAGDDQLAACFRFALVVAEEPTPWIELMSPDGGEIWDISFPWQIKWDSIDTIENVKIELSENSGTTYTYTIAESAANTGEFTWFPIPSSLTGGLQRIRVSDAADSSTFDVSDSDFAIAGSWILVTSPDGGEKCYVSTAWDITWEAIDQIEEVKIDLSLDSGDNYTYVIAETAPNTGFFTWEPIPPSTVGDQCRIMITDTADISNRDESDDDFSISGSWLKVTSPNGGEEWEALHDHEITWDCSDYSGTVFIEYSKDNFVSDIQNIVSYTPNDGSYIWEDVPVDISDTVRVRIFSAEPWMSDMSDSDFSIVDPDPFVRILTPNGGEDWGCGSLKEITWWSYNVTGNVDLFYSKDNFVSDNNLIAEDIPVGSSYMWFVPPDFSDTVRVKAIPVDFPSGYDVSDDDFSIV